MNELIKNYKNSLQAIYDHVGFVEDWVIYPIDDRTGMYWTIIELTKVRYAETEEQLHSDGDYYEDDIYTQRFYKKHIYEGNDFTLIFCDPHTDGMRWFALFNNSKKII